MQAYAIELFVTRQPDVKQQNDERSETAQAIQRRYKISLVNDQYIPRLDLFRIRRRVGTSDDDILLHAIAAPPTTTRNRRRMYAPRLRGQASYRLKQVL